MAISIYRGTTPTVQFQLPDDIPAEYVAEAWMTFARGKTILFDFSMDNGDLIMNGNTLSHRFSQEETLSVKAQSCEIGIRLLMTDGSALCTLEPEDCDIIAIPKDGVIYDAG